MKYNKYFLGLNSRLVALIAVMAALGNIIGIFGLPIPAPIAGGKIELHFSQLPPLLMAMALGPIPGAFTGFLSLIIPTVKLGNPFIPFGNAILAGVAGIAAKRLRPFFAGMIGIAAETPYMWASIIFWVGYVMGVPLPAIIGFTSIVNIKAVIEVAISCTIIEILISREAVKNMFLRFR